MKNLMTNSSVGFLLLSLLLVTSCLSQNKAPSLEEGEANSMNEGLDHLGFQIGEYVIEIFEDSKGNLWFGTLAQGVARYDGHQLKYFTSEDGLNGNRVGSIIEDSDGNLWFGTHSGIAKYDGQTFKRFDERDGLCSNQVSHLLLDQHGTLWIGTWGGVCTFNGSNFVNFPLPKPDIALPPYQATMNWLTDIAEDAEGNMWFARDGYGVCKYDGKSFTHYTKEDGLASNAVRDIQEDHQGNIWFGSRVVEKDHPDPDKRFGSGGLTRYDGEDFISFPDLAGLNKDDVYEIYRDVAGNIWIGTRNQGVYKYDGKQFANYSENNTESGFPKSVVSILADSEENIWLGCAGGLFRLNSAGILNVTTKGPWE